MARLVLFVAFAALVALASAQADPCRAFDNSCQNCVSQPGCGFCQDFFAAGTSACLSGDVFGPNGDASNCTNNWNFEFCDSYTCNQYTSCTPCAADPMCVWCTDASLLTDACVNADAATVDCAADQPVFSFDCNIPGQACNATHVYVPPADPATQNGTCERCPPLTVVPAQIQFRVCNAHGECRSDEVDASGNATVTCRCNAENSATTRIFWFGLSCQFSSAFSNFLRLDFLAGETVNGLLTGGGNARALVDGDFEFTLSSTATTTGGDGTLLVLRLQFDDNGDLVAPLNNIDGLVSPAGTTPEGVQYTSDLRNAGFLVNVVTPTNEPYTLTEPIILTFDYSVLGFDDVEAANLQLFAFTGDAVEGTAEWRDTNTLCAENGLVGGTNTQDAAANTITVALCEPNAQYQVFLAEEEDNTPTEAPTTFTLTFPTLTTRDDDTPDADSPADSPDEDTPDTTVDVSAGSAVVPAFAVTLVAFFGVLAAML